MDKKTHKIQENYHPYGSYQLITIMAYHFKFKQIYLDCP